MLSVAYKIIEMMLVFNVFGTFKGQLGVIFDLLRNVKPYEKLGFLIYFRYFADARAKKF